MKNSKLIFAVFVVSATSASSQNLTLDQAVKTALQNNPGIKSAEYQIDYFKEVKKTGTDIGKLSATWMHGQYNSIYQDNNLTLQQAIPFPSALINQVKLGKEQVAGAQQNLIVQQNNLAYEVKSIYLQLLYQMAQKKLLASQDSLYADFANASSLRFKTGESNLLEKTTAETQRMEIQNLRRQNLADIQISEARLKALLKSDVPITAANELKKREAPTDITTESTQTNPSLGLVKQEVTISQQYKRVELSRILPDFTVGGFVQSLTGLQNVNGQDIFYARSRQFTGFQLGLAIPLWIRPNLARANAARFQEESMQKKAQQYEINLAGNFEQALRELDKNEASINYYETSALQNAELILSQSKKAFHAGEISYIEYLQSLKISIGIKSNYLQALNQYNQSVVTLEFLLGKF
jgi:cobalt-zinc-cadmium resistance protein CzcA